MTFTDQATLSGDADFRARIAACVAVEEDTLTVHPTAWADQHQWQVAAAPGFGDAYAYALSTGVERPGNDPAVITDAQILAAVQTELSAA